MKHGVNPMKSGINQSILLHKYIVILRSIYLLSIQVHPAMRFIARSRLGKSHETQRFVRSRTMVDD